MKIVAYQKKQRFYKGMGIFNLWIYLGVKIIFISGLEMK